jgi:hypothetical protein
MTPEEGCHREHISRALDSAMIGVMYGVATKTVIAERNASPLHGEDLFDKFLIPHIVGKSNASCEFGLEPPVFVRSVDCFSVCLPLSSLKFPTSK